MRIPLRRLLMILLSALPVLLIAGWALWVLHDVMRIRDRMGTWRLTVIDQEGTVLGRGQVDLRATAWKAAWTGTAPFLRITPELDDDGGWMRFDEKGSTYMDSYADGHREVFALEGPSIQDDDDRVTFILCIPGQEVLGVKCALFGESTDMTWTDGTGFMPTGLRMRAER